MNTFAITSTAPAITLSLTGNLAATRILSTASRMLWITRFFASAISERYNEPKLLAVPLLFTVRASISSRITNATSGIAMPESFILTNRSLKRASNVETRISFTNSTLLTVEVGAITSLRIFAAVSI